jgi:hypothetical protein
LFGDTITIHVSGNRALHWRLNTDWGCWRIRAPRKIFGPKTDEITGEWKRLLDDELGGAFGTRGRQEVDTEFRWGNPKERDHLEDLGVIWRIILKLIFMK